MNLNQAINDAKALIKHLQENPSELEKLKKAKVFNIGGQTLGDTNDQSFQAPAQTVKPPTRDPNIHVPLTPLKMIHGANKDVRPRRELVTDPNEQEKFVKPMRQESSGGQPFDSNKYKQEREARDQAISDKYHTKNYVNPHTGNSEPFADLDEGYKRLEGRFSSSDHTAQYLPFLKLLQHAKVTPHDEPYSHGDTHDTIYSIHDENKWNKPFPLPRKVGDLKGVLGKGVPRGDGPDPFAYMDRKYGATAKALLDHYHKPLDIHTRSDLVAHDDYMDYMNPKKHTINMHIMTHNDSIGKYMEPGAPSAKRRMLAIKKLREKGFKVNLIHDVMAHPEHGEIDLEDGSEPIQANKKNIIPINDDVINNISRKTGMDFKAS